MRVLVVHNRYRLEGGEERAVELQLAALRRAGIVHALLERSSTEVTRSGAARALLRGGRDEEDVAAAARELGADVVHFHNMLPLFGPRSLAAARDAGARVVLQLHNLRLFCAIGVAARDGGPCFRCHHRFTLPGLALNCRGSLPEAAVYAAALSRHQPAVLRAVDSFVVPSRYAAGQVAELGLPAERVAIVPHYLPESAFAHHSRADEGLHALVAARLSPEKGIDTAIEASARAAVPLHIAGEGPLRDELEQLAARLAAPVRFLGRLDREALGRELARGGDAAAALPLPRVRGLRGARGDGGRRAGARHDARRSARARGRGAHRPAERRGGSRHAHGRALGRAGPARPRGRRRARPRERRPR